MTKKNQKLDNLPRIVMLEVFEKRDFPRDFLANYHTHLICHRGKIDFIFNEVKMSCKRNEFLFWFAKSNLRSLTFSKGFSATILLVENKFLMNNIPDQSWGIDAELHSRRYPVKQLKNKEDQRRVLSNFQLLNAKFLDVDHHFHEEALKLQMKLFILEMWHTFVSEYERKKRSLQTGTLYERFRQLVQDSCMKEREVKFYANQLNISEVSDEMGFSSRSFFTRYVKKVLGCTPSDYRNRLG